MYRIYANQRRGTYLRAVLNTIVIPLSTVFTRISAAPLINPPKCGPYSSNYCNWQLQSLLHLGQIVITFRAKCYYIQDFITFRVVYYIQAFYKAFNIGKFMLVLRGLKTWSERCLQMRFKLLSILTESYPWVHRLKGWPRGSWLPFFFFGKIN